MPSILSSSAIDTKMINGFSGVYLSDTFGSSLATIYAYNACNVAGHTKKVTVDSLMMIAFGVGNILGTEIFQPKDAPYYIPSKTVIIVLMRAELGVTLVLKKINVKRKEALAAERVCRGWTEDDVERERQRHAFMDLTDKQCIELASRSKPLADEVERIMFFVFRSRLLYLSRFNVYRKFYSCQLGNILKVNYS